MRKNNRYFLVFLIVFVSAIFLFFQRTQNQAGFSGEKSSKKAVVSDVPGATSADESTGSASAKEAKTQSEDSSPAASTEFKNWFNNEAKNLETSSVDPKVTEGLLREKAKALSAAEVRFVKEQVLATHNSANDRILASYLLTLSPEVTSEALTEVMMAPLKVAQDFAVHSTTETLSLQEKSLRHMAIDALIDRARQDKGFRDELQKKIAQIPEPSMKAYAEKAYKRLQ